MNNLVIKLFNKAIPQTTDNLFFHEVNTISVKYGYLVHPDVCNKSTLEFVKSQQINYNSTFYKSWEDVVSKSREELFFDQIRHYFSKYGTNYQGEIFVPNKDKGTVEFTNFKTILPITKKEVSDKCLGMLYSGIALSQETIEDVLNILTWLEVEVDIELVKNKEANMFLYKSTGKLPNDPVEMIRYLVYLSTGKTLLIKNRETIAYIKSNYVDISTLVEKFGYKKLSSVFYRFKPILLAYRYSEQNRVCVNKLRRLAKINHEPYIKSFFEDIISNQKDFDKVKENLKYITNFKKISILQAILVSQAEVEHNVYLVRNQKVFIKPRQKQESILYKSFLFSYVYKSLIDSIKEKKCTYKLSDNIDIKLPTSEKSFSGNYPFGTRFDLSNKHSIVGIHWKQEDGASDLDLSLVDIDGGKYGWNASYYNNNNNIVFSGDMTSANPEAVELFYTKDNFKPCIVKINNYNGQPNSKFKFFIANEEIVNMKRNYMVNQNNIIFNIDSQMDSQEKCLGVITGKEFILTQMRTGNGRVSNGENVTNAYTDYVLSTVDCFISLKELLSTCGFTKVENNPDIDFDNLSKDTLIDLLS